MTPTGMQIAAALEHASQCLPREACGVFADDRYLSMRNAAEGEHRFVLDMREFHLVQKMHKIDAIVHSHVGLLPLASEADHVSCARIGLPFVIISHPAGNWTVIEPARSPLVGRLWKWPEHDCFALIRDGLYQYGGIVIPDYQRDQVFWKNDDDLVGKAIPGSGFVVLPSGSQPQHLDVLGFRVRSHVVNHLGLFLAPDSLLHQYEGQLSFREPYSPLAAAAKLHLRHERFMEMPA